MQPATRILFISRAFTVRPETQSTGLFVRFKTLLKGAAHTGAEIRILFLVDDVSLVAPDQHAAWELRLSDFFGVKLTFALCQFEPDKPESRNTVRGVLKGALSIHWQSDYLRASGAAQAEALRLELEKGVDVLFVHRLGAMPPVMRLAKSYKLPRVFFDLDDIEHIALRRSVFQRPVWFMKRLQLLHVPALARGEARAAQLCEHVFVCSETDVLKFQKTCGTICVAALPNTVAIPPMMPPATEQVLLFLGTFIYEPNKNAIEYFLDEVWPLIRLKVPNAKLLVGGNHSQKIKQFSSPPNGVEFAGFIPDLTEAYRQTRAVICPILSGGGTRVKLVEAAAYARPMVSTTIGAEGLDFETDSEILIGDTASEFAAQCVRLMLSYELAATLGEAAHRKALYKYSQDMVVNTLSQLIMRPTAASFS